MKSPTTTNAYIYNVNAYLIPSFGHIKLQKLTATDIQKVYNAYAIKSPLSDKPLSAKTIRNLNMNLQAALEQAIKQGKIKKNVAKDVELPKYIPAKTEVYNHDELILLLEKAKDTDMELILTVLVCFGLRRGEVLALTWDDIDFENAKISINKSVVDAVGGGTVIKEPKTPSSVRTLDIPKPLLEMFRKEKSKYAREKLSKGKEFSDEGFIFHTEFGHNYTPNTLTAKFRKFLIDNDLKLIRLHDLRHSNATMMLSLGISPKVAQKRLGHSSYSVTMDTYDCVKSDIPIYKNKKLKGNIHFR